MDDKLFDLCWSRMRPRLKPQDETVLLTPNPESARWVVRQWLNRTDGALLAGVMGSAAATETSTTEDIEDNLTFARYEQLLQEYNTRQYYWVSEFVPAVNKGERVFFRVGRKQTLLVHPDNKELLQEIAAKTGVRLIEVDVAWVNEMWMEELRRNQSYFFPEFNKL